MNDSLNARFTTLFCHTDAGSVSHNLLYLDRLHATHHGGVNVRLQMKHQTLRRSVALAACSPGGTREAPR